MAMDSVPVRSVQELAMDGGGEPPSTYTYGGDITAVKSYPLAPIPIIDTTLLFSSVNDDAQQAELAKLRSAVTTWGCFQAINHGISSSYLDKMRQIMKEFFQLSPEEKSKYARQPGSLEGYGGDLAFSKTRPLDWYDFFFLKVFPEAQRNLRFWPDNPSNLRESVVEYTSKVREICENLLKTMAKLLKIKENSFLEQIEATMMEAQFSLYPACRRPEKTLGLKEHSDASTLTVLLQDKEVGGLQLLKDDQWLGVEVIPHALFINVGDQLEIMSNGKFKSSMHRVVTNTEKERMSIPVFYKADNEVEPVKDLITLQSPKLYKKVKFDLDYFSKSYLGGSTPLEAAKI